MNGAGAVAPKYDGAFRFRIFHDIVDEREGEAR
jgi:hypothetical protein